MFGLVRWSPYTSPFQLRREIDDVFGRFFGQGSEDTTTTSTTWPAWTPAVEATRENGEYVIRVALSGVDPKDVEVSVMGDELTIKGQRQQRENMNDNYFVRELAYGAFERKFNLPEGVDAAKVYAKHANGMLEVHVPEPVAIGAKKIDIEVKAGYRRRRRHRTSTAPRTGRRSCFAPGVAPVLDGLACHAAAMACYT